jgi:hypothetical protein
MFTAKSYVVQFLLYKISMSTCMMYVFCCTKCSMLIRMFDLMSTGDWLYMLLMHQACVYKTKHQYVKSNELLTTVIKEAYNNDHISDILKKGIEAFQVKSNLKHEYLAYYLWKNIHNCYNAMTTFPVESINYHIKHKTKASTLNNTSRLLMLITEGTDSRIPGIDKSAKCELQVTFLSSKLTMRNLYHQKCIYLLNRLFDNKKNQCCVMHAHGEWIVWQFQHDPPYFQDDELNLSYLFPVFANVYNVKVTTFGQQGFLNVIVCILKDVAFHALTLSRSLMRLKKTMIKVQHQKAYQVHYGDSNSNLSNKLMQATSLQTLHEDMGMPISDDCLDKVLNPTWSL